MIVDPLMNRWWIKQVRVWCLKEIILNNSTSYTVFHLVFGFSFSSTNPAPHLWSRQTCLSPFYNKLKTYKTSTREFVRTNAKTLKRPNDGKPQVLDSARKYRELIGQKWYHTFVDIYDITTGGIAHLSPATTRYDNKFYIIKLVIKLYIWSQFCELAMPTDVFKTSRVL